MLIECIVLNMLSSTKYLDHIYWQYADSLIILLTYTKTQKKWKKFCMQQDKNCTKSYATRQKLHKVLRNKIKTAQSLSQPHLVMFFCLIMEAIITIMHLWRHNYPGKMTFAGNTVSACNTDSSVTLSRHHARSSQRQYTATFIDATSKYGYV